MHEEVNMLWYWFLNAMVYVWLTLVLVLTMLNGFETLTINQITKMIFFLSFLGMNL